jgi:thiol:disulfide interchange protein
MRRTARRCYNLLRRRLDRYGISITDAATGVVTSAPVIPGLTAPTAPAPPKPISVGPWGEAAFDRAIKEDKPILLDIGAVWCHWCHVMDRESYEDAETAQIINEHFVAVKVDRDERPDVDARYQAAVSAISGQGGWPLTAFLTPEGQAVLRRDIFSAGRPAWAAELSARAADHGGGVF